MRRASRFGRLTSITSTPAAVRYLVSVAPNEPVLSTPIERTSPWLSIQASSSS
jgi:hypothetical protein